jgi:hypothetical protein
MADDLRRRVLLRLAGAVAAAALAVFIASQGERVVVGWASGLARDAALHERPVAIARLERLGHAGVPALIRLSLDRTPLPLATGAGPYAGFLPRDTVGDIALDALRRIRLGDPAPRLFEWDVASGVSFGVAFEQWRQAETDAAVEWLKTKRGGAAETP